MDNKTIQSLIYDQLYAASMYDYMTTLTKDEKLIAQFRIFEANSRNNARILEVYYEELNTSSFNPILNPPVKQENIYSAILWMINYNGKSNSLFIDQVRRPTNDQSSKDIATFINTVVNQHNTILIALYLEYLDTKKTSPM